jgi:hypothetical protein
MMIDFPEEKLIAVANDKFLRPIILSVSIIIIFVLFWQYLPVAVDWQYVYRPATLLFISGKSPYAIQHFHNPPWTLIPFIPLALLPEKIGQAIEAILTLAAVAYLARKSKASFIGTILILLSPPIVTLLRNGNIDAFVLFGLALPPQIGLFLLLAKPQVGAGIAVFLIYNLLKTRGIKNTIKVVAPVACAIILITILYGDWLNVSHAKDLAWEFNYSLWPYSLPIGIFLLWWACRKNKLEAALLSSPLSSPYTLIHSWIVLLFAAAKSTRILFVVDIALWVIFALKGFN